jgi:murein DD-endopeptidase MepM/ murein hydrolase activator NlpD
MITASQVTGAITISGAAILGVPVVSPPLADILRGTAAQYLNMGIGWPLGNEDLTERRSLRNISSAFGPRSGVYHIGIDINQCDGVPLLAVTSGVVEYVSRDRGSTQGYTISIRSNLHKDPVTEKYLIFTYMHMQNAPTFIENDPVSKGAMVGRAGNTGSDSSGPHLHFEVSNSGDVWEPGNTGFSRVTRRVNPVLFYPAGSFTGTTTIWDERR